MKRLEIDGYCTLSLRDGVVAYKFDDKEAHGDCGLKAVDMIVELPEKSMLVEVKRYDNPDDYLNEDNNCPYLNDGNARPKGCKFPSNKEIFLRNYLTEKFKDTILYRLCEGKQDNSRQLVFLSNLAPSLCGRFQRMIKNTPPFNSHVPQWTRNIFRDVCVVNQEAWNRLFQDEVGRFEWKEID